MVQIGSHSKAYLGLRFLHGTLSGRVPVALGGRLPPTVFVVMLHVMRSREGKYEGEQQNALCVSVGRGCALTCVGVKGERGEWFRPACCRWELKMAAG